MGTGEQAMELAPAYALALDLEAQGLTDGDLAEALGVPAQAVRPLLAMAHAKAGDAA